jgi:glycosyltransferase involved in cell wall biosynthesis
MKITFVTFGNISQHSTLKRATGMAPVLSKLGLDVSILLEDSPDNRERAALECPGVQILYHQRHKSALKERAQKVTHLRELRPDVVWICGVGIRNWILPQKEFPVVLGDHAELLSGIVLRSRVRRGWDYANEWAHLPSFSGQICASRYLEKLYTERNKRLRLDRPVHYSPYAYNSDLLESEPLILQALKKQYGDKKNVLYMGSFWENYGFWDMLHVFEQLTQERADVRFLMMGKGPEKEAGIAWLEKKGLADKIQILGYIPEQELSSYFHLADAFVCPLRDTIQDWARCPSKLFMYLPFNKPIVTCPIGEALEIFGEDGFYYSPGSRTELRSILHRVLDLKGWSSSVNARDHSWQKRCTDFLDWLRVNEEHFGLHNK